MDGRERNLEEQVAEIQTVLCSERLQGRPAPGAGVVKGTAAMLRHMNQELAGPAEVAHGLRRNRTHHRVLRTSPIDRDM